jgi:hypothetical protein
MEIKLGFDGDERIEECRGRGIKEGKRMSKEFTLGILMRGVKYQRAIGDAGNPKSYPFPVRLKVVWDPKQSFIYADHKVLPLFVQAAKELEKEGVSMIITTCGFLVIFQDELANAVKIPVISSSLLQVPLVHRIFRSRIGIITANAKELGVDRFKAAGAEGIPIAVEGLESKKYFSEGILQNGNELNIRKIGEEVVEAAETLLSKYPDTGAFVLECHNLPPYSKLVQQATGRPVFDILSLVESTYRGMVERAYEGIENV